MLVEVACPLCGSERRREVFPATRTSQAITPDDLACTTARFANYDRLVRCLSCGLRYTSPRPEDGEVMENYRVMADTGFLTERGARERTYRRLLRLISRRNGGLRGRLLEVGWSMGFFMNEARADGWDVEGIEPSRWAAEYARKEYALVVHDGTVAGCPLEPDSWDVITIWDVVEHLLDPVADLRRLAGALRPGGLLAFSTHSIRSLAARVLGARYPFLMAMHVTHFTPRTSAVLCRKAGLRQVAVSPHLRFLRVGYLVKKLEPWIPWLGGPVDRIAGGLGLRERYVVVTGLGIYDAFAVKESGKCA